MKGKRGMNKKKINTINIVLNLLIILSTIGAVGLYFFTGPDALGSVNVDAFKFFTTESNIFVAITALIMLIYNIKRIKDPDLAIPKWAAVLKYAGATSVALTFVTVVVFLAPTLSISTGHNMFFMLFAGNVFFLHFSTPVIAAISVIFFERDHEFTLKDSVLAVIPMFIYSIVYVLEVGILQNWPDWYGFTFGGRLYLAPIVLIVMYAATWCLALIIRKARSKYVKG